MIIIPRKKVKMEWWIYHHKPPIRTWQLIRAQAGPAPGHVTSVLCATCGGFREFPKTMSIVSDFLGRRGLCDNIILVSRLQPLTGHQSPLSLLAISSILRWALSRKLDKFSATIINRLTWGRCFHNSGSSSRLSRGQGWAWGGGLGNPGQS